MRVFVLLVGSVFLCSCLPDRSGSDTPVEPPQSIVGEMRLMDFSGDKKGALIFGGFWEKDERRRSLSRFLREDEPNTCSISEKALTEGRTERRASKYLSVGKLYFGLPDSLKEVSETDNHFYGLSMDGGLPAGDYAVLAKGSEKVKEFNGVIALPSELEQVQINGEREDPKIELNQGMSIQWKSPQFLNGRNALLFRVTTKSEFKEISLICLKKEKSFDTRLDQFEWKIKPGWTQKLAADEKAFVEFSRFRGYGTDPKSGLDVVFIGQRIWYKNVTTE